MHTLFNDKVKCRLNEIQVIGELEGGLEVSYKLIWGFLPFLLRDFFTEYEYQIPFGKRK